jgi:GH25 family lysozyme M1 (1,4-beta-N-acetylmuramidase)
MNSMTSSKRSNFLLKAALLAMSLGAIPPPAFADASSPGSATPKPEDDEAKPAESTPPAPETPQSRAERERNRLRAQQEAEARENAERIGAAIAAACTPHPVAMDAHDFWNRPRLWGTTDAGPIVGHHVAVSDEDVLMHGVDISHHNDDVDYARLAECGTEFAFVKMDQDFGSHAASLRSHNISVIPYHFLSSSARWNGRSQFMSCHPEFFGDAAMETQLLAAAEAAGRNQAATFLQRYASRVPADRRTVDLPGLSGQLIAIDVEATFANPSAVPACTAPRSTPDQNIRYGRYYGRVLSTWVGAVREQYPDAIILLYTDTNTFATHLAFATNDDYALASTMPVWVAQVTDESGRDIATRIATRTERYGRQLQALCLANGAGNRCIFHQYTHRGLFGAKNGERDWAVATPVHHDVDRYLGARPVVTEHGITYVRPERHVGTQ